MERERTERMERDRRGRFLETSTGLVEWRPRLGTLPARSSAAGAWLFIWRNPITGRRHAAEVERAIDSVRVSVDGRRSLSVRTRRYQTHPRGWDVVYLCRLCSQPAKHLYIPALACRRCSGLRYGCEGGFRRRLERQVRKLFGHMECRVPFKTWNELRIPPEAGL